MDVQLTSCIIRVIRSSGMLGVWASALGTCDGKNSRLFLDKASARWLSRPSTCMAENQKLDRAARNTNNLVKCIMWAFLL